MPIGLCVVYLHERNIVGLGKSDFLSPENVGFSVLSGAGLAASNEFFMVNCIREVASSGENCRLEALHHSCNATGIEEKVKK